MKAVSLFASGGIGDLALRSAGVDMVVANEILPDRADILQTNFPESKIIVGDIWDVRNQLITACIKENVEVMFATPPCQGMSKNGRGKLLQAIRNGEKEGVDKRNLLVIPAIDVYLSTPSLHTLVMENVPEMESTIIPDPEDKKPILISDYIKRCLGAEYIVQTRIVEFANYGVPQRRQRLISIFSKHPGLKKSFLDGQDLFPRETHSKNPDLITPNPWVTVRDAIGALPPLDASSKFSASYQSIPFHRVPLLDSRKYFWVSSTPPESGAFDNQCVKCGFDANPVHSSSKNYLGINQSSKTTPVYCIRCNELLPRPVTEDLNGNVRLMSGFTSAYRRMKWDEPSSTLTRNLSYACSDKKLHPDQNRVLSLYEAMILHTITDYDYQWTRSSGAKVSDKTVREIIGESIPPLGLQRIFEHIFSLIADAPMSTIAPEEFAKVRILTPALIDVV